MSNQIHPKAFLPLQLKDLTKELRFKAEKELHETEYNRRKGIENLRQFIKEEGLPERIDDELLLQLLRVAKFDLKNCRERLVKYCAMRGRTDYVEMYDEEGIMALINANTLGFLPYRDSQGAAIMYSIADVWDPTICTEKNITACHCALIQYVLSFPVTTVSGMHYVVNSSTNYPRRNLMDITVYKNNAHSMLSLPIRLKGVIVLQANAFIRFCYGAIRHFLPTKVTSRMHIQKELEITLPNFCHPSILPTELGGTMGPVSNDHFKIDFQKFLKKMKSEDAIFYDPDN